MNKELTEKLYEKYPQIFKGKKLPMSQSLVCFGFEYGDGWYELTEDLCKKLQVIADLGGPQFVASQMKEKFAGLRFYGEQEAPSNAIHLPEDQVSVLSAILEDIVSRAESKSYHTCEECGEYMSETFVLSSWYYALCPDHAADLLLARILGKWPSDAGATTTAQKLELIKEQGSAWGGANNNMLDFAKKHLNEQGISQMLHIGTFLESPTPQELELIWLWYMADECSYSDKVLKLLDVPEGLREECDLVQWRLKSHYLCDGDSDAVCKVTIAIMMWETAELLKQYKERAKHGNGVDGNTGAESSPAGTDAGETDPASQESGKPE